MAGRRRRAARAGAGAPSFLLAAALLAAVAGAGAQLDGCAANPSLDACKDYAVPQAALETDLARVCASSALGGATYSGWPSACTLWHECQAGRAAPASCQPLALLQTACNEPGAIETDICMTYLLLCAPGSKVQQCEQQPPIRELKPPMQYYSAVQKLCNGTTGTAGGNPAAANGAVANASLELELGSEEAAAVAAACKTCSAMSDDPNKVVVQATQANCPDPLGTLSTLCQLAGDAPSANASCAGWDALCSSEVGAGFWGLCGGAGPAPAPAPAEAAEDNGRASAASAPSGQEPTAEASVKVPAAGAAGVMPAAGAPAPAPANAGSGSSAATTSGGGSSSLSNDATVTFQKMYLHASMSAVILFKEWVPTSGGAYIASCLAIIAVAVAVQALKALSQQTEARWEAQRYVGAFVDTSGSGSPTYGHTLSRSSIDSQNGHEPRRSSAMSTLPMLRGMGSGAVRSSLSNGVDGAYAPRQQPQQFVTREELTRNAQRALFTGATIFLDLMLMLVAMTFNLGLIICITLGYMLGALAFGHLKERGPVAAYAGGSAKAAPTNPLFIIGSMQPTAEEAYDPMQLEQQRSLRQIHTQA